MSFLHWVDAHACWMAKLIVLGEITVGVLLILGCATGLAALLGATMNLNYVLAGSAGVNAVFLAAAFLLMLAWRNAGWIGVDRWLLPALLGRTHRGRGRPVEARRQQPGQRICA